MVKGITRVRTFQFLFVSTYGSNLCALDVGLSLNVNGDRKLTFHWENVTTRLIEELEKCNTANGTKCGTISPWKCKGFLHRNHVE